MAEKKWCVYMHTNKINGKKYIGITSKTPARRWGRGSGYKNQYFGNAVKKYGWNNFEHEVLFSSLTLEEANKKEIELIKKYDTTNRSNGYNVSLGGDGVCGFKASEESKKKMSESHKGFRHTSESKTNMRKTNAQKKAIYQLNIENNNIIREFESTSKAIEIMNKENNTRYGRSYISRSARFFKYFAFGYKWIYKDDYENKTNLYCEIIKKYPKKNKSIDKIDLKTNRIIKTYNSIKDASGDNNINPNSITKYCISKKEDSISECYWRYSKERIKGKHIIDVSNIKSKVLQIDPETREIVKIFNSNADANEYFGRKRDSYKIGNAIMRGTLCDGFYWEKSVKEKYE